MNEECDYNSRNFTQLIYSRIDDPNKSAYIFKGNDISYGELRKKSSQIASLFKRLNLEKGDKILFFLNDTPALVFGFLAAAQIGAIPILLNPKAKSRFISHYLNSSSASAIICEAFNYSEVDELTMKSGVSIPLILQDLYSEPALEVGVICPEKRLSESSQLKAYEGFHVSDDGILLWQYTSGTTGLPKAIPHSKSGILHSYQAYAQNVLNINSNSLIYSTARLFFGYGLGNAIFFNLL